MLSRREQRYIRETGLSRLSKVRDIVFDVLSTNTDGITIENYSVFTFYYDKHHWVVSLEQDDLTFKSISFPSKTKARTFAQLLRKLPMFIKCLDHDIKTATELLLLT